MNEFSGFDSIKTPEKWKTGLYSFIEAKEGPKTRHRRLSMALAAVLILSVLLSGVAIAVGLGWHEQLLNYLQPSKQQISVLESGVNIPEATVTQGGITVTVKQTLADSFGIYVLYEMTVPDNVELNDNVWWESTLLNVPIEKNGEYVAIASTKSTVLEQSGSKRTVLIHQQTSAPLKSGKIELILQNLISFENTGEVKPFSTLIDGDWTLNWDFSYVDTSKAFEVSLPINIGESRSTIEKAVISPISICIYVSGDSILGAACPVVNFKDGSSIVYDVKSLDSDFSYYLSDEENGVYMNQLYYRFKNIIDLNEVSSIRLGDQLIPVE